MEKRELTKLEKGIIVNISKEEFEKLKNEKGFLSKENYPKSYQEIALGNEVGRFLLFRFLLEN